MPTTLLANKQLIHYHFPNYLVNVSYPGSKTESIRYVLSTLKEGDSSKVGGNAHSSGLKGLASCLKLQYSIWSQQHHTSTLERCWCFFMYSAIIQNSLLTRFLKGNVLRCIFKLSFLWVTKINPVISVALYVIMTWKKGVDFKFRSTKIV